MNDETRGREAHDWPDEEGGAEAQKSLRDDVGASFQSPKEEASPSPAEVGPAGELGPAGSGRVPGRGALGSSTPTDKGAEQGSR